MKKKFSTLLLSLLLGAFLVAPITPLTVNAAEDTGLGGDTTDPIEYGLVGDFIDPTTGNTQDWQTSTPFAYQATVEQDGVTWYSFTLRFEEGDEFKGYKPASGSWISPKTSLGLDPAYFEPANPSNPNDSNWKVLEAGVYEILLRDGAESIDDAPIWDRGDPVQTETATITYYHGGEVIDTDVADIGAHYNPHWVYQDGYVLAGWYLDASLDPSYYIPNGFTVEGDTSVYGLYNEAGPDLTIYHDGNYTYAHYWNDVSGAGTEWPGVEMSNVENSWSTVHKIVIPAEYESTRIIFHSNAGEQTSDLVIDRSMILADGTYPYWGSDSGWYSVDSSNARTSALSFIDHWVKEVRVEGDVCYLEEDAAAWAELKASYEDLNSEARAIVDSAADGDSTIGETMAYLSLLIDGTGTPSGTSPYVYGTYVAIGVSSAIVLLLLISLAFIFVQKKKKAE